MYIPRQKSWNISTRFCDFHISAPKSWKYPGNAGISWKFPGNVKLRSTIRNQVTLNDNKFVCLRSHIRIQSVQCRLPQIYIFSFESIKTTIGEIRRKKEGEEEED